MAATFHVWKHFMNYMLTTQTQLLFGVHPPDLGENFLQRSSKSVSLGTFPLKNDLTFPVL